jgi:hypothetical protein
MTEVKPYAFQKFIDEQKHLDTDETRHLIKPIQHVINRDFKGEEHLYCDKSQLCPLGKYRKPKIILEAERRGFNTIAEMVEADKKAEEEKKVKQMSDLRDFTQKQNDVIQQLITKQDTLEEIIRKQNDLLVEITNRLKK